MTDNTKIIKFLAIMFAGMVIMPIVAAIIIGIVPTDERFWPDLICRLLANAITWPIFIWLMVHWIVKGGEAEIKRIHDDFMKTLK